MKASAEDGIFVSLVMRLYPILIFFPILLSACGPGNESGQTDTSKFMYRNSGTGAPQVAATNIKYTHVYDTLYTDDYSEDPDTLYQGILKYRKDGGINEALYNSAQGKIFIEKMREIRAHQSLVHKYHLPDGARIIERQALGAIGKPDRELVLWMQNPKAYVSPDDHYVCQDYTTGKAGLTGKAFISLIDTKRRLIRNTIPFLIVEYEFLDTTEAIIKHIFHSNSALPIACVKKGRGLCAMSGKYFTIGGGEEEEGKVQLIKLMDYNQDGIQAEFALYCNSGCLGTTTKLYGYSKTQDKVMHYPINITLSEREYNDSTHFKDTTYHKLEYEISGLFALTPQPFPRKYAIDYQGRGGNYHRYKIDYNRREERFEVELNAIPQPGDDKTRSSWVPCVEIY